MTYSERGLHGQIVHTLGRRIVSGRLAPGGTFDIAALERELGVSRTVLREAFKVLAAKGLVDARQKRGTFVTDRDDWSLLDADVLRWQFEAHDSHALLNQLAEVRAIIEPAGARLAAIRRTDNDIEVLQEALEAMAAAADDGQSMVDADLQFHRALLAATHNELLTRMELVIEGALAERDRIVHADRAEDPLPTHLAVFEAVRAGDPDRAEQAMTELLAQAQRDVDARRRTRRRNGRRRT